MDHKMGMIRGTVGAEEMRHAYFRDTSPANATVPSAAYVRFGLATKGGASLGALSAMKKNASIAIST
jgi:hypothetical protein